MFLNKKTKIVMSLFLASLLLMSCGKENETAKTAIATEELLKKYDEKNQYIFEKEIKNIKKNQPIEFDVKSKKFSVLIYDDFEEPAVKSKFYVHTPIKIFGDYALTEDLTNRIVKLKRENGKLTFIPEIKNRVIGSTDGKDFTEITISEKENWGLRKNLYVVQYNDLNTGKLLEKPIVHTYFVNDKEDKIKAPFISSKINENGYLEVTWEKVENANKYYIIYNDYYLNPLIEDEIQIQSKIIGETTDNKWVSNYSDKYNDYINRSLRSSNLVDDDEELYRIKNNISNTLDIKNKKKLTNSPSNITVIAGNRKDYSKISNGIALTNILPNLTNKIAYNVWESEIPNTKDGLIYDSIDKLPTHAAVSMLDGKVKFLPYEIELDKVALNRVGRLIIPIKIKGSNLTAKMAIDNPPSDFKEQMAAFNEKIAKNALTGNINEFDFKQVAEINLKSKVISDKVPEVKDEVFATTALGYFIASNLIDNVDIIDLKDFPNSLDKGNLWDTIREASSQNPTIAFIENINLSIDGRYVEIIYVEKDRNTRIKKQNEIREKLDKVAEDIKKSTTDKIEQVRKINNYLCENGEYDFEAFDAHKKIKSSKLDNLEFYKKYENAYSTYGISVQNKGVCASYAKSFNYLAKKVGLESIYVTGFINGDAEAGHAWNAVKIDDEWRYFDSTWNDGDEKSRELYFNLRMDDPKFAKTHELDDKYILKNNIDNYRNK